MESKRPRQIAIVTGSRADYGHLRGVLRLLRVAPAAELKLLVTGMHLSAAFGSTWREIEADGFPVDSRIDLEVGGDAPLDVARSVGRGVAGFGGVLSESLPDVLVLFGDRYEMLAAASAGMLLNIPIAHIHGGEVTVGAFDDAIRHAITKMALVHFVAAEPYRQRVIQLGEHPDRVFNVGAPGLDQLFECDLIDRSAVARELGIPADRGFLLVTLHPTTARPDSDGVAVRALLEALDRVPDRSIVFTGVNSDPGHSVIGAAVRDFVDRSGGRARLFVSLGSCRYVSALRHADAVVGNSSSGLIEAPALGTPTVNVGDRQAGRLRAASVVDCEPTSEDVAAALERVLAPDFREQTQNVLPPYGRGGASAKIAEILLHFDFRRHMPKRFFDLGVPPR
jgi:UDP-hydrolysing UDP-N-acetyl-D-glucosamine 2-epimerase